MASKVQGTKNRRAAAIQNEEVLASVKGLNLEAVSKNIGEVQVEVQRSLAELSAKLTEQLQQLENINGSIVLRSEELERLHDIQVKAETLDNLQAEIEETRRNWEGEQLNKKREFAEQQSDRNRAWKREESEYQYNLSQEHKKLEDSFAAVMAQREKQNRDKQEELEKQWNERETELKKREQELAELRLFKDNAPEMIKKEVNAAVAVATNSVKKEYETQKQLAAKDAETEKRLATQEISALNQTLNKQQTQLDDLKADLVKAHERVAEISGKALDSASGRATSEALQRLLEKETISSKGSK
jgi:uncharacterized coiled-coil protein SlyX